MNLKKTRRVIFLFFAVSIFTSCEGIVGGGGFVYSAETLKPLENVNVTLFLNGAKVKTLLTDAAGSFEGSKFVGCVPKCPSAIVKFEKDGYQTYIFNFDSAYSNKNNLLNDSMIMKRDSIVIKLKSL